MDLLTASIGFPSLKAPCALDWVNLYFQADPPSTLAINAHLGLGLPAWHSIRDILLPNRKTRTPGNAVATAGKPRRKRGASRGRVAFAAVCVHIQPTTAKPTAMPEAVRTPTLLFACSAHGLGHLAQIAAVIEAVRARRPQWRLLLRGGLDPQAVRARLGGEQPFFPALLDPGMANRDAASIDVAASLAAYQAFDETWEARLQEELAFLKQERVDLVLADVPWLSVAASVAAGLPAALLCSIDWFHVLRHYAGQAPEAGPILARMLGCYRQAEVFLAPEPAMPMPEFTHVQPIPPIASRGRRRSAELRATLGVDNATRLGLVSLGGLPFDLNVKAWPGTTGFHWIVPREHFRQPGASGVVDFGWPFLDLLASCDVLVTKPGYGSFVEAASHGLDVLWLPRGDWPEEPALLAWLDRHTRHAAISREELTQGRLTAALAGLPTTSKPEPPETHGAEVAADWLIRRMEQQNNQ